MPSVPLTPPTAAAKVNLHCRTSFVCIFLGCIASAYNQQQLQQQHHHHPINLWTKAQSPFVQLAHFPVAALVKHACAASPRYRCCCIQTTMDRSAKPDFVGHYARQDNNKKHNIRPSICAWGLPWCVLGIFHSLLICPCPYIHTLYAMLWHVSCSCRLIFCSINISISCCVSHQYALQYTRSLYIGTSSAPKATVVQMLTMWFIKLKERLELYRKD